MVWLYLIWILNAKMELVAHFQVYYTVTAVSILLCIGNIIGNLLLYGPKLYAVELFYHVVKKQDQIWSEGWLSNLLYNDQFLIGKGRNGGGGLYFCNCSVVNVNHISYCLAEASVELRFWYVFNFMVLVVCT